MAQIKPFQAVRPVKELAEQVAALPYDVYNREEAVEAVRNTPFSFLKIDRAETQFGNEVDTYDERVYQKAKELFEQMQSDGVYQTDPENAYYIYQLEMNGRCQTGIVACASVDDYQNNRIKKHENTREEKEQDRIRHVDALSAQTGPIFLAYRSQEKINKIVNQAMGQEPIYDFVAEDGIGHRVWKVSDPKQIKGISQSFDQMDDIYIADGHHRAASAVKVGLKRRGEKPDYDGTEEFNYFLSVLFPDDQLMILDYNRCVKDLNGLSVEEFLKAAGMYFEVSEPQKEAFAPKEKGQFTMYLEGQWYLLQASSELLAIQDPVESLDVSLLQNYLLNPVLGIQDPRTDSRIDFVGGIRGLQELERRAKSDMKVAFAMYPTSIGELFEVADARLLMPPKSTWFEPKLRSGLFIHKI